MCWIVSHTKYTDIPSRAHTTITAISLYRELHSTACLIILLITVTSNSCYCFEYHTIGWCLFEEHRLKMEVTVFSFEAVKLLYNKLECFGRENIYS